MSKLCSFGKEIKKGSITEEELILNKNINFKNGAESFEARVASATSGGTIEIRLDGTTGPLVGTCKVEGTGGWQTWATVTCDISGASGVHDLYLVFKGGESYLFNINWWKFKASETAPTPTSSPVKSIDINKDGVINMADVIIIAGKFNTVV